MRWQLLTGGPGLLHAIGFDLGTSGLKAVVVDETGRVIRSVGRSYPLEIPCHGRVEQAPEAWWQALLVACRSLMAAGPPPDAIGLAGQMHTAVVLGPDGAPLGPAMLWNDQRTTQECVEVRERIGDALASWTGNPIRTAFTASKILWLRRHQPELYRSLRAILLPKDFLRLRLTGVMATDVTDASGTGVFDVRHRRWSNDALAALGIRRDWLPDAYESLTLVGQVDGGGAAASGLPAGTPVSAGAGDQAAAVLGSGSLAPGTLIITLGTSATVQMPTTAVVSDPTGILQTFCHALPDTWQLLAAVLSGGGSLDWYGHLGGGEPVDRARSSVDFERIGDFAEAAPPGAEGLIFLPYLTGEAAPHLDPDALGAWFGLTRRHDHRHLARAVIEGVAFGVRGVVEATQALTAEVREIRVSGGGSHGRIWLRTLADVLGRTITSVGTRDASARGAALLAIAAASGRDPRALAAEWALPGAVIEPDPVAVARYEVQYAIFQELYPATRHLMHRLAVLDGLGDESAAR